MVAIHRPPPSKPVAPVFHSLKAGQILFRLQRPGRPLFRFHGPLHRFDHHIPDWSKPGAPPKASPDRGACYFGRTLSGCLVEVFGDTRIVTDNGHVLLSLKVTRTIKLLDLRGPGAIGAGTVAAISGHADTVLTQEWARYFYEDPTQQYRAIDGLIYANAHNHEDALVIFERAKGGLNAKGAKKAALKHPSLRRELLQAAAENNLVVMF